MRQQETEHADFDGYHWSLASSVGEDDLRLIREHLDRIEQRRAELAPDDRTWFRIPEEGSPRLFVKLFRHDSLLQRSRYTLFGSQAETEWKHLLWLYDRNIPVPLPLAIGQSTTSGFLNTCVLVTKHIEGCTLREVLENQYDKPRWSRVRTVLWSSLAEVTAQLISTGFNHRDYHDQNIVVERAPGSTWEKEGIQLYVTDLHRAGINSAAEQTSVLKMLAFLIHSLTAVVPLWECQRFYRFLQEYQPMQGDLPEWPAVMSSFLDRRREHRVSRTKNCFKSSDELVISTHADTWDVHRQRTISDQVVPDVIRCVSRSDEGSGRTDLKTRSDGRIMYCNVQDSSFLVKEQDVRSIRRKFKRLFGYSKPRCSWENAHGLRVRGIKCPTPIALVEPTCSISDNSSYFIQQFLSDAHQLDQYPVEEWTCKQSDGLREKKDRLIESFARYLRMLHREGVFHKDLKASNILLTSKKGCVGPTYYLIDLDRVTFYDRALPRKPRIKNLAQLNGSFPQVITTMDRKRFWNEYVQGASVPFSTSDDVLDTILQRTIQRNHKWP